ncbi:MAG: ribonuclease III [Rhodospirillales bacterium]|nr:ribonuclease III [Rhodospirillales bacterium]MDE0377834.1 ribonuclease III [Rhodospirillales bacterium]
MEAALGHRFASPALLARALRHPSAGSQGGSNQRLEFLGDRVLGMVVAAMLYEAFPHEAEGALSQRYAALVRREALADVARALSLGPQLAMGRGEVEGGGRDNPANLADACEAVIGALYIDGGLGAAERFIRRRWAPAMAADPEPPRDAKTRLQEWTQARALGLPAYRTLSASGPAHAPLFEVEADVPGLGRAVATGASKRAAEQGAAGALLAQIARNAGRGDG